MGERRLERSAHCLPDLPAPSMDDQQRAVRLLELIEELVELNTQVPVVVEGKRDRDALRKLGLKGEVIVLNCGAGHYEFCEALAGAHEAVVLLMDWDGEGQRLQGVLERELEGMWEEFEHIRRVIKMLCQKDTKDVEGIPKLLLRLTGDEAPRLSS